MRLKHLSLFSGIGGFDLAAEWAGWENVAHCEWNEFGQRVLKYYWPDADSHSDITKTDFTKYEGAVDIISGGFPCQPYSQAGKRKGKEDERHLWPEMLRAIREIKPSWVVGENVFGLVNWNGGLVFQEVQSDLEAEGYEVQPYILPAAGVGAPHRRDRVWFVAYKNTDKNGRIYIKREKESKKRRQRNVSPGNNERICPYNAKDRLAPNADNELCECGNVSDSQGWQKQGERTKPLGDYKQKRIGSDWENFPTKPPVCGGDDGLSRELDSTTFPKWRNESIKAYGNAIVPQVAYQIFKAINEYEKESNGK